MGGCDIAYELTKAALENGAIKLNTNNNGTDDSKEASNSFNAKQISDFYNSIFNAIKKTTK